MFHSARNSIGTSNGLKKWFSQTKPNLVLSINSKCDDTSQIKEKNLVCKTIVKILPPQAVLITGEKDGIVDCLVAAQMASAKKTTPQHQDDTNDEEDKIDFGGFTIKRFNILSVYHRWESYCFEKTPLMEPHECDSGKIGQRCYSSFGKEVEFRVPGNIDISKTPIDLPSIPVFVVHLNLITRTSIENGECHLEMQMKGEAEKIENIVQRIDGRTTDQNLSEIDGSSEAELPSSTIRIDGNLTEEQLLKSIAEFLFRLLISEEKDKEEEAKHRELELFNSFIDRWYDEEFMKELLKLAAQGKKPEFSFDSAVNEPWIDQFIRTNSHFASKSEKTDIIPKPEVLRDLRDSAFGPIFRYKIIFIWCVQKGMESKLYMKYWDKGQNKLAMALLAYKVSRQMAQSHEGSEFADKMQRQMKHFEDLATTILWRCFSENKDTTFRILMGQIPDLLELTPYDIALDINFKEFIAQEPCRALLDCFWTWPFANQQKRYFASFAVSAVLPFLAPLLMKFYDDREQTPPESEKLQTTEDKICLYFKRVKIFLNVPVIRFIYASVSHLLYLVLFSFIMLTNFRPKISELEILLDTWTLVIGIEEIKQAIRERENYLTTWNVLDNAGLSSFMIGFILRITYHYSPSTCPECLYTARIVFACSLMFFILRTLQLLSIDGTLGPKIHMIHRLLADLISFMLILGVFIAAYGIGSNIILYPNQPLSMRLLKDILYDSSWSVLENFNREEILGLNCNPDGYNITAEYCRSPTGVDIDYEKCKASKCPANIWIVDILLAIYAFISVIMMLNVLIAIFNDTFTRIHEKQLEVYSRQRYWLMLENSTKSLFPAPLCAVTYWKSIPWCVQALRTACKKKNKKGENECVTPIFLSPFRCNLGPNEIKLESSFCEMSYSSDKATEAELSDVRDKLAKLKKSDFNRAVRLIDALPDKESK